MVALALECGRSVEVGRLAEYVWGDSAPPSAPLTIRSLVSRLRTQLGPSSLVSEAGGRFYRLGLSPDSVDLGRFIAQVEAAREHASFGQWIRVNRLLTSALAEWRGRPLSELADSPATLAERTRLEELQLGAVEFRGDALLALGRQEELLGEWQRLVTQYPLRERFWAQLMLALYRAGRQSDALSLYQNARTTLIEELGVEPGYELRELELSILSQDPALSLTARLQPAASRDDSVMSAQTGRPTATPIAPATNLSVPASSLTARVNDLARAIDTVRSRRLVTLLGPGGVGKTRLAIQVGLELATSFPDGVWMVDLSATRTPDSVINMIAGVLEVSLRPNREPLADLTEQLSGRRLLVVLDNCEHLLDAAAAAASAIARVGSVHVLATTRELLAVDGETVQVVSPLDLDDAVTLFEARRHKVVDTSSAKSEVVQDICRRLDGLPLAIELAAASTIIRTPYEILNALRSGDLRSGPVRRDRPARHRDLRAVVSDSYHLQPLRGQLLFRRLAVFAADADLATIIEVCGAELSRDEVEDRLVGLVSASMVVAATEKHRTRFRLLETMRTFARLWLAEDPDDLTETERRHTTWAARLVAAADTGLRSPQERDWYERLDLEFDEIRLAFDRALSREETQTAASIVGPLQHYAVFRVRPELFQMATRVVSCSPRHSRWTERVQALAAWAAFASFDLPRALKLAEVPLSASPSTYTTMVTVSMQAAAAAMMGDAEQGRRIFAELTETALELEDRYWLPFLVGFGMSCRAAGIDLGAEALLPEAQTAASAIQVSSLQAFIEVGQGYAALGTSSAAAAAHLRMGAALANSAGCTYLHDYARAGLAALSDRTQRADVRQLAAEARRWMEAGDRFQAYVHLLRLVDALQDAGNYAGSARLLSATERLLPSSQNNSTDLHHTVELAVQLSEAIVERTVSGQPATVAATFRSTSSGESRPRS